MVCGRWRAGRIERTLFGRYRQPSKSKAGQGGSPILPISREIGALCFLVPLNVKSPRAFMRRGPFMFGCGGLSPQRLVHLNAGRHAWSSSWIMASRPGDATMRLLFIER